MTHATRLRLSTRFAALMALVVMLASCAYAFWRIDTQQAFSEGKALAEARTLNTEMTAVWDYVNSIQSQINRDSDGRYDFKNVYCAIAGKAIAQRFMSQSDYSIRYVREDPRSVTDTPDEFEQAALDVFEATDQQEYFDTSEHEGRSVFRYVSVLRYEGNCLACHGEPAGEKDETGFLKEGRERGDIAGAASIIIPMSAYREEIQSNTLSDFAFFLSLILCIILLARGAFSRWVSAPLARLDDAAQSIGRGKWDIACRHQGDAWEIDRLASTFEGMAQELRSSYSLLETKVEERTAELAHANERLTNEMVYKQNFFSTMGHELKTPVSSIRAANDIWRRRKGSEIEGADEAFSNEVRLQSEALLDMVDNVLETSRIEQGGWTPTVQVIDMVDVLDDVERSIGPMAERKSIDLRYSVDDDVPLVESDWDSVVKIIRNLTSNAVKFTPAGGTVRLHARTAAHAGVDAPQPGVFIDVTDTGVGIERIDQERVFERFVQLDASLSREHHGSGLGLSLSRDLAAKIGATIALESEPEHGSTFTVCMPARWAPEGDEGVGREEA